MRVRFESEATALGLYSRTLLPDSTSLEGGDAYEIDRESSRASGAVQLKWQKQKKGQALSVGLELGGDRTDITTAVPGRVRLVETKGKGAGKGAPEREPDRLVATFHGTFHRKKQAAAASRITFEIAGADQAVTRHDGRVLGFDPECVLGLDALVLTFVNREFVIPFPFFVDTASEGQELELVAIAELGAMATPTEIGRSAPFNLPIRQTHEVETTTKIANKAQKYTAPLVGHQILHHVDYLANVVSHPATANPSTLTTRPTRILKTASAPLGFEPYKSGALRIILMNDLLDDLVPDTAELKRLLLVPRNTTSKMTPDWVRRVLRAEVSLRLNDLFLDAGFAGMAALWDTDQPAASALALFKTRLAHRTSGGSGRSWELKSANQPLMVSFWTFFAVFDNANVSTALGVAESPLQLNHRVQSGSTIFHLPYPAPIGSGTKNLKSPIRIDTGKLTNHLTTDLEDARRPNRSVPEARAKSLIDLVAGQLAAVVAHEVGHSLGLMHDVGIEVAGVFRESTGNSAVSIMSSSAENSPISAEARFSDQAKVIWQRAFGVSPTFAALPLRNKTWSGDEWQTVGWVDRMNRLRGRFGLDRIVSPEYVLTPTGVPPFAKKSPAVQKGTHIP